MPFAMFNYLIVEIILVFTVMSCVDADAKFGSLSDLDAQRVNGSRLYVEYSFAKNFSEFYTLCEEMSGVVCRGFPVNHDCIESRDCDLITLIVRWEVDTDFSSYIFSKPNVRYAVSIGYAPFQKIGNNLSAKCKPSLELEDFRIVFYKFAPEDSHAYQHKSNYHTTSSVFGSGSIWTENCEYILKRVRSRSGQIYRNRILTLGHEYVYLDSGANMVRNRPLLNFKNVEFKSEDGISYNNFYTSEDLFYHEACEAQNGIICSVLALGEDCIGSRNCSHVATISTDDSSSSFRMNVLVTGQGLLHDVTVAIGYAPFEKIENNLTAICKPRLELTDFRIIFFRHTPQEMPNRFHPKKEWAISRSSFVRKWDMDTDWVENCAKILKSVNSNTNGIPFIPNHIILGDEFIQLGPVVNAFQDKMKSTQLLPATLTNSKEYVSDDGTVFNNFKSRWFKMLQASLFNYKQLNGNP